MVGTIVTGEDRIRLPAVVEDADLTVLVGEVAGGTRLAELGVVRAELSFRADRPRDRLLTIIQDTSQSTLRRNEAGGTLLALARGPIAEARLRFETRAIGPCQSAIVDDAGKAVRGGDETELAEFAVLGDLVAKGVFVRAREDRSGVDAGGKDTRNTPDVRTITIRTLRTQLRVGGAVGRLRGTAAGDGIGEKAVGEDTRRSGSISLVSWVTVGAALGVGGTIGGVGIGAGIGGSRNEAVV